MDTNNQLKSFWQRPEGTTGKVLVVGALALLGFLVFHFMGAISDFLVDTMRAAYAGAALLVLGFIVTSKRMRTLLFYALETISSTITKVFVEIDPVGILRAFVKDMQEKRKTVSKAIEAMMGVKNKSVEQKKLKTKEMNDALKLADAAQQVGNMEKLQELTERVGRRQKRISQLDENIQFSDESIEALKRVDRVIEYHINNATDEADDMESDYDLAIQTIAATHAANEALGDTDKLTVRNMAVDVIRDKVATATASVDRLLETTRSVQGEMDLSQLSLMQDGVKKLNELRAGVQEQEQEALRAGGKKPLQASARVLTPGEMNTTIVPSGNRWADRLKTK